MAIIDQFHFHPPARNRRIPSTLSRHLQRSTVVPIQLSVVPKQQTRHFRRNPSTNISWEIGEGYQSSQIFVLATPFLRPTLAPKRRQDHDCEPRWRWSCQKRIKNLHASPKAKSGQHANSPQYFRELLSRRVLPPNYGNVRNFTQSPANLPRRFAHHGEIRHFPGPTTSASRRDAKDGRSHATIPPPRRATPGSVAPNPSSRAVRDESKCMIRFPSRTPVNVAFGARPLTRSAHSSDNHANERASPYGTRQAGTGTPVTSLKISSKPLRVRFSFPRI